MSGKKQIIIIPGIMGSVLKKQNTQIWPWLEYLPGAYENLNDIDDEEIAPYKLESYTYKLLKKHLNELNELIDEFPYDWRKNNLDHLSLLEQKINLKAEEVIIVAHSMGGIIGKLFLNQYRDSSIIEKVTKFITLGTPWNGAMDSYKTLKYGKSIPEKKVKGFILNEKSSKKIAPYFPSIYQLLPSVNYCKLSERTEDKVLVPYRVNDKNYYDIDQFFVENLNKLFVEYDHEYIKVFEEFYDLLNEDIPENIKHFEVIGLGSLTIAGISENSLGEAEGDFRNGDGTVPLFSALSRDENTFFVNKVEHQDLPKDLNVINLVKRIIIGETNFSDNSNIFSKLSSEFNKGFNGQIVKIACPVSVSLMDNDGNIINGAIQTIDEDGIIELLGQEYNIQKLGNTTYVVFNDNQLDEYVKEMNKIEEKSEENKIEVNEFKKIIIQAYDRGPTTVAIEKYVNGQSVEKSAYKTFEINPSIKAELTLSKQLEENELIIDEIGKKPIRAKQHITKSKGEIILPITEAEIFGTSTFVKNGNEVVIKGQPNFKVTRLEKGTYDIDETFIKFNGKIISLKGEDEIVLDLKQGETIVEYFSKDIFGNIESCKKIIVNYLPEGSFEISLEFVPHQYFVDIKNKFLYEDVIEKYKLDKPKFTLEFDNDKNVFGNNVFYGRPHRKITVMCTNIFKEEEIKEIFVDESVVLQVFEGTVTEKNLQDFINSVPLQQPKIKFTMPGPARRGRIRKIIEENISKCEEMQFEDEHTSIRIIKNKKYTVSFQNLSEDIIFNKDGVYPLEFKIIDKERNQDIRTIKLQYFIKVTEYKDDLISENYDVVFDTISDAYKANISLKKVYDMIKDYWVTNEIINFEVVIVGNNNNELRTQNISFRKK